MKKVLSVFLTFAMVLSLTACSGGKQHAFMQSKMAYSYINDAYTVIEKYGEDIYEAWRTGIYDKAELKKDGLDYLAEKMSLSVDELKVGFAYAYNDEEWDTLSEEEKNDAIKTADTMFRLYAPVTDSLFSLNVLIVTSAYTVSGKSESVEENLNNAKEQMKQLSENYSDYEHYPSLKGYYTTTNSFFELCQNPTGSFEQFKSTLDDYRNEARDFKNDLEFIFVE